MGINMNIKFTKYKNFYYGFSGILFFLSLLAIVFLGVVPGVEFSGGSVIEVKYEQERPTTEQVVEKLESVDLHEVNVQPLGEDGFLIKVKESEEQVYEEIIGALEQAEVVQFEAIGPTVGSELKNKSVVAVLIASVLVIFYISIIFQQKSGSVSSLKYGVIATGIAFFHDIFILIGIFAVLGYFYGVPVTVPVVVALLTTLGYSLNDTVVIFDRIRENLRRKEKDREEKSSRGELEVVIDKSLNEVLGRSLSTSVTTLLVLFSLLFLVGGDIYYFTLALIMGVVLGTYSSIFLAGPLVLDWNKEKKDKNSLFHNPLTKKNKKA
jgi:preprotein translocase subunit SecF